MSITNRQLNLAGWLLIANAVLMPISLAITLVFVFLGSAPMGLYTSNVPLILTLIIILITLIRHGVYVYVFYCLKKLLNSRFQFQSADIFISQIIRINMLSLTSIALFILSTIIGGTFKLDWVFWISLGSFGLYGFTIILVGILYILTAVEISRLYRNVQDAGLRSFSRSLGLTGWLLASLFLAPLGFLLTVQTDTLLGSIFFNIARES